MCGCRPGYRCDECAPTPPERYDAPPERPIARCIECNDKGERGGNTAFACRCTARRVKRLEIENAELRARLTAFEARLSST